MDKTWQDLSYTKKGLMVGLIIGLIGALYVTVLPTCDALSWDMSAGPGPGQRHCGSFEDLITVLIILPSFIFVIIPALFDLSFNLMNYIIVPLSVIIAYGLIGSLIGLIVGKLKRKK